MKGIGLDKFYFIGILYLKNIRFPLFFTLLFFVGMLVPIIKSERRGGQPEPGYNLFS